MYFNKELIIAKSKEKFISLNPGMLNRHGVITGASGSGKTVTLKVIAETLSQAGIPSIVMDIKGDLSGCARIGEMNENIEKRVAKLELDKINYELKKFPIRFWDVYGDSGTPIRLTVSDMGPTLLSIILGLSEAGESLLNIAFQFAENNEYELLDLSDLKSVLQEISETAKGLSSEYGNINPVSVNTIIRKVNVLQSDNGKELFGEPNLVLKDLMAKTEETGSGYINIIECRELVKKPTLYASLLVWLLTSFYEKLPEVGDLDKPKAVLFLDEAHLIFSEMPKKVIKKITQIIKLIRSKGISVFFISQSPADIPDEILGQLGNRVQHCLRAYTPQELKAVKTAASTLRENPNIDTEKAILELGTGEALVSFVDHEGMPSIVELAKILPPQSYMGEISEEELKEVINNSEIEKYRERKNRPSATEKIEEIWERRKKEKEREEQKKNEEKARKAAEKSEKNTTAYRLKKKATNKLENIVLNKVASIIKDILSGILVSLLGNAVSSKKLKSTSKSSTTSKKTTKATNKKTTKKS